MSGSGLHLRHDFLGPSETTTEAASVSHAVVFAQITEECTYTLQWAIPPPQNCPFHGDLDSHLMHGFLGTPECWTQMTSRSVQPFLQGSLLSQTDWQTDSMLSVIFIYFAVCTSYLS